VTPVQFPEGLPSEEEFDPRAAEVTHDGKFVYHKMIKNESEQVRYQQYYSSLQLKKLKSLFF